MKCPLSSLPVEKKSATQAAYTHENELVPCAFYYRGVVIVVLKTKGTGALPLRQPESAAVVFTIK